MKSRPYQDELHSAVIEKLREKKRSILVRLPTGGGKTFIAARMFKGAEGKGNPAIFLCPRRELVYQSQKALRLHGVEAGIIMAGEPYTPGALIQVCSIDTLHARAMRTERIELPPAKIVIMDEAHLSMSETRREIIEAYPDAIQIGLTATPARGDGRPLGDIYEVMVQGWSTRKMMDEGFLVEARYFGPSAPDLKKIKTVAGDYSESGLEKVMNKKKLIGDIVDNWMRIAHGLSTVVFCVSQAHARAVHKAFKTAGVAAEYVDANTPDDERAGIFARMSSGESTVLCNVFVASYGLDIPRLACCILARPTKSVVLYLQMAGRTLRPLYEAEEKDTAAGRRSDIAASSKPCAVIIDHTGTVNNLGLLHYDFPWSLHGDETVQDGMEKILKEKGAPKQVTCPSCKAIFVGSRFCPSCGFELIPPGEDIPVHQADLQEIEASGREVPTGKQANRSTSWPDKVRLYSEMLGYARAKGYASGWVAHFYHEVMGVWPNDARLKSAAPMPPTDVVMRYVKWRAIRRMKINAKEAKC